MKKVKINHRASKRSEGREEKGVLFDLKLLKKQAQKELEGAADLRALDEVFKRYLGKKGELTQVLRSLEKLPKTQRLKVGKAANELKNFLRLRFDERVEKIREEEQKEREAREWLDVTLPGHRPAAGTLHPLTQVKRRVEEIFQVMGFYVAEGPEMENEWYNFDALNIPKDHPARDLWDTFYLKNGLILRTHTSPVQIRYMEKNQPPIRIIAPGRIFRHEATDASHEFNLYQVEGLMVDREVSAANFKAIIEEFLQRFLERPVKIRMRPSFFPFTEPSFEVDMSCTVCGGKGCSICGKTGWLEMMGAGMVHPAVLKAAGLTPHQPNGGGWQGFAFGIGMERLAMMKYKVNDIRLFYSGNFKFLDQF